MFAVNQESLNIKVLVGHPKLEFTENNPHPNGTQCARCI